MSEETPSLEGFRCLRCGKCCRWKGPVRVSAEEIDSIAAFLGMDADKFIRENTYLCEDRRGLSLNEKKDGSCAFLDDETNLCKIEKVKPRQCRNFPFTWNFPGWDGICEGGKKLKQKK